MVQSIPPSILDEELTDVKTTPRSRPDVLGDIRIGERLAAGASSEMFHGMNLLARKRCVVKIFRPELDTGPVNWGRYGHAVRSATALQARTIADIYGFGQTPDGRRYAICEWVTGDSLEALLAQHGALSRRSFQPIVSEIAKALSAAHKANIPHLRLHAGNVMVQWTEGGRIPEIRILDFGSAFLQSDLTDGANQPLPRTPAQALHISPEQAKGQPGDNRSDVYALAILLYRMATGRSPFQADTFEAMLEAQASVPPSAPSQLANITSDLEETLMRALDKDPKRRTPSVEALASELDPAWAMTAQHQRRVTSSSELPPVGAS